MAGSSIVYMLLLIVVLQRDIGHNKLTAMGERCSCVCGVCVCGVCVVSIGIHTLDYSRLPPALLPPHTAVALACYCWVRRVRCCGNLSATFTFAPSFAIVPWPASVCSSCPLPFAASRLPAALSPAQSLTHSLMHRAAIWHIYEPG